MNKILLSLMMLCSVSATWAEDDGFVTVASASQMYNVLSGNAHAKVRLTADIYLSDLGADFEDTFCSTFYGVLDGDGHAIKGDHYADNTTQRRNRTYLFTYSDGATIKNITFKHINKSSTAHDNQCILTSQAKNNCVFENITFDNCGASCDEKTNGVNVGAVVGSADHCIFTNITVKNSDFTVEFSQVGAVVGEAKNCTFTNIKVDNCKITSHHQSSGGVAGRTDDCTISNVEILGTFIKADDSVIGGVVGNSTRSDFINCIVDDQSCVCADGMFSFNGTFGEIGGIVGLAYKGSFTNCINSALIAADGNWVGGIAGKCLSGGVDFEDCLNTGMVISMDMDDVESFYNKYKTKSGLTCVTKTYKGKEYVIRKYEAVGSDYYVGGIVGEVEVYCTINRCANLGSVYSTDDDYVGGIAGRISLGKVTNCLTDFHAGRYTDAICPAIGDDNGGECFIGSCLNMTTYKDFSAYDNNWVGFKSDEKNYSLTTNENVHHVNKTTAAKIKSGEICHLLGEAWEQNLGTDPYPTPTGGKGVYHTRTVNNQYGTVCLPYYLEPDDKISYYCVDYNRLRDDLTTLKFKYIEEVRPGLPVLFRVKDFDGTPQEVTFNCEHGDLGFENAPYGWDGGYNYWSMGGTFEEKVFTETTEIPSNEVYYLSNGEIRNAKKVTIAPFRAFLYRPDLEKLGFQAKTIQIEIEDENGETTDLELVGDDFMPVQQSGKSYSLMGTEVGEGYRGLVIRNGKIMIQKR